MNLTFNDINFYIELLKSNKKFSFTRWGDGEWSCAFGVQGANCDSHTYFPEMGKGLNEAIDNPKGYFLATWPNTEPMMFNIWRPIQTRLQNTLAKDWVDASIWEEAAMAGELKPFVEQLEKMNFIIISEGSKRSLPVNYTDFIEVPATNCFLEKDRIKQTMIEMCEKYDNPVFGLSASMATNVIVDELYKEIGDKCWMIDLGSIWEPFLENPVHARSYHTKYKSKVLK
tara:strand:- start:695 stop:1378 length:684 start_codon:yes stop_codon:yes gene_type:complete